MKKSFHVEIDPVLCKGCDLCCSVCPKKILELGQESNKMGLSYAQCIDEEKCIGCVACAEMCPDAAITIYRKEACSVS